MGRLVFVDLNAQTQKFDVKKTQHILGGFVNSSLSSGTNEQYKDAYLLFMEGAIEKYGRSLVIDYLQSALPKFP